MMTTIEAAERLGVNRQWIWRLIKAGRLKGEQRGRDYFIPVSEIERYEQERKPAHRPKKSNAPERSKPEVEPN